MLCLMLCVLALEPAMLLSRWHLQEGDSGLGLFASAAVQDGLGRIAFWRRGWWSGLHDTSIASFGLDQAISAQQVILDSGNSAFTQELLQEGNLFRLLVTPSALPECSAVSSDLPTVQGSLTAASSSCCS